MESKEKINKLFIGVDNGKSGYISAIDSNRKCITKYPIPIIKTTKSKWEYDTQELNRIISIISHFAQYKLLVVIEKSQALQGAISTHSVTRCASLVEGLVVAYNIPYILVRPQEWKKEIFKGIRVDKEDSKGAARLVASRLWPELNFSTKNSHDLAESLLMAEYGRRLG